MSQLQTIRAYLAGKADVCESTPFAASTLLYTIDQEPFAVLSCQNHPAHLTLRCDPRQAQVWRDLFPGVAPGYAMNRRSWNVVTLEEQLSDETIFEMIDEAYRQALHVLVGAKS